MSGNNPLTANFLKESFKRPIGDEANREYRIVGFFNQKLDINRFFIEDSDGQKNQNPAATAGAGGMPQVEFGASDKNDGTTANFDDNTDPFEDDLEDALCVFKSGGD